MAFTVQSISCIACTPFFHRSLGKIGGVLDVRELPVTNKVIVEFDETQLGRAALEERVVELSKKAGFGGVIFQH